MIKKNKRYYKLAELETNLKKYDYNQLVFIIWYFSFMYGISVDNFEHDLLLIDEFYERFEK